MSSGSRKRRHKATTKEPRVEPITRSLVSQANLQANHPHQLQQPELHEQHPKVKKANETSATVGSSLTVAGDECGDDQPTYSAYLKLGDKCESTKTNQLQQDSQQNEETPQKQLKQEEHENTNNVKEKSCQEKLVEKKKDKHQKHALQVRAKEQAERKSRLTSLRLAVKKGDVDACKTLLDMPRKTTNSDVIRTYNSDIILAENAEGKTALCEAAKAHNFLVVKVLLDACTDEDMIAFYKDQILRLTKLDGDSNNQVDVETSLVSLLSVVARLKGKHIQEMAEADPISSLVQFIKSHRTFKELLAMACLLLSLFLWDPEHIHWEGEKTESGVTLQSPFAGQRQTPTTKSGASKTTQHGAVAASSDVNSLSAIKSELLSKFIQCQGPDILIEEVIKRICSENELHSVVSILLPVMAMSSADQGQAWLAKNSASLGILKDVLSQRYSLPPMDRDVPASVNAGINPTSPAFLMSGLCLGPDMPANNVGHAFMAFLSQAEANEKDRNMSELLQEEEEEEDRERLKKERKRRKRQKKTQAKQARAAAATMAFGSGRVSGSKKKALVNVSQRVDNAVALGTTCSATVEKNDDNIFTDEATDETQNEHLRSAEDIFGDEDNGECLMEEDPLEDILITTRKETEKEFYATKAAQCHRKKVLDQDDDKNGLPEQSTTIICSDVPELESERPTFASYTELDYDGSCVFAEGQSNSLFASAPLTSSEINGGWVKVENKKHSQHKNITIPQRDMPTSEISTIHVPQKLLTFQDHLLNLPRQQQQNNFSSYPYQHQHYTKQQEQQTKPPQQVHQNQQHMRWADVAKIGSTALPKQTFGLLKRSQISMNQPQESRTSTVKSSSLHVALGGTGINSPTLLRSNTLISSRTSEITSPVSVKQGSPYLHSDSFTSPSSSRFSEYQTEDDCDQISSDWQQVARHAFAVNIKASKEVLDIPTLSGCDSDNDVDEDDTTSSCSECPVGEGRVDKHGYQRIHLPSLPVTSACSSTFSPSNVRNAVSDTASCSKHTVAPPRKNSSETTYAVSETMPYITRKQHVHGDDLGNTCSQYSVVALPFAGEGEGEKINTASTSVQKTNTYHGHVVKLPSLNSCNDSTSMIGSLTCLQPTQAAQSANFPDTCKPGLNIATSNDTQTILNNTLLAKPLVSQKRGYYFNNDVRNLPMDLSSHEDKTESPCSIFFNETKKYTGTVFSPPSCFADPNNSTNCSQLPELLSPIDDTPANPTSSNNGDYEMPHAHNPQTFNNGETNINSENSDEGFTESFMPSFSQMSGAVEDNPIVTSVVETVFTSKAERGEEPMETEDGGPDFGDAKRDDDGHSTDTQLLSGMSLLNNLSNQTNDEDFDNERESTDVTEGETGLLGESKNSRKEKHESSRQIQPDRESNITLKLDHSIKANATKPSSIKLESFPCVLPQPPPPPPPPGFNAKKISQTAIFNLEQISSSQCITQQAKYILSKKSLPTLNEQIVESASSIASHSVGSIAPSLQCLARSASLKTRNATSSETTSIFPEISANANLTQQHQQQQQLQKHQQQYLSLPNLNFAPSGQSTAEPSNQSKTSVMKLVNPLGKISLGRIDTCNVLSQQASYQYQHFQQQQQQQQQQLLLQQQQQQQQQLVQQQLQTIINPRCNVSSLSHLTPHRNLVVKPAVNNIGISWLDKLTLGEASAAAAAAALSSSCCDVVPLLAAGNVSTFTTAGFPQLLRPQVHQNIATNQATVLKQHKQQMQQQLLLLQQQQQQQQHQQLILQQHQHLQQKRLESQQLKQAGQLQQQYLANNSLFSNVFSVNTTFNTGTISQSRASSTPASSLASSGRGCLSSSTTTTQSSQQPQELPFLPCLRQAPMTQTQQQHTLRSTSTSVASSLPVSGASNISSQQPQVSVSSASQPGSAQFSSSGKNTANLSRPSSPPVLFPSDLRDEPERGDKLDLGFPQYNESILGHRLGHNVHNFSTDSIALEKLIIHQIRQKLRSTVNSSQGKDVASAALKDSVLGSDIDYYCSLYRVRLRDLLLPIPGEINNRGSKMTSTVLCGYMTGRDLKDDLCSGQERGSGDFGSRRWRDALNRILDTLWTKRHQFGEIILPCKASDYNISLMEYPLLLGFTTDGCEVAVLELHKSDAYIHPCLLDLMSEPDLDRHFILKCKSASESRTTELVAFELCDYTLAEYIQLIELSQRHDPLLAGRLAWQLLQAVKYIHHNLAIPHGNLKPSWIFVDSEGRLRLGGYGIVTRTNGSLDKNRRLGLDMPEIGRSTCWASTEELNMDHIQPSMASDIQVAGMLLYFILTNGQHPFGSTPLEAEMNIARCTAHLEHISEEADDLVSGMLFPDPVARPAIEHCLKHPFFWSSEKKFRLILIVGSDVLTEMKTGIALTGSGSPTMMEILSVINISDVSPNWVQAINPVVMKEMRSFRVYKNSLSELTLFIYNCCLHFDKISSSAKEVLDDPCRYFLNLFPSLFMSIYRSLKASDRTDRSCFKPFF